MANSWLFNSRESKYNVMGLIRFILKHPVIFYVLYLMIGLAQIPAIGISWDEPAMRALGASAAKYIVGLINPNFLQNYQDLPQFDKIQDFQLTPDGDHGVIFELGLLLVEAIFKLSSNTVLLWQVRHLLTFLFCSLSIVFIFKLLDWRFESRSIAYLGTCAFVLTPRIYGDSFFNEKDSVFLTTYLLAIFFLIKFFSERSLKSAVLAGLSVGFSIAIRPLSIGLILILLLVWSLPKWRNQKIPGDAKSHSLIIFLCVSAASTFVFFPYLWQDPIRRSIKVFLTASSFPWSGEILTNGQLYSSLDLPWYYLFLWIGVTIPLFYIPILFFGILWSPIRIYADYKNSSAQNRSTKSFADALIYLSALGPLAAVIFLRSTLYDGWRHLYFVFPSLLIIGVHGLVFLYSKLNRQRTLVRILLLVLFFNFFSTGKWMLENRPLQNVYFNQLAGQNIRERWEMDYWGLANREMLDFLTHYDSSSRITIYVASATPLFRSLELIEKSQASRIEIVSDVNKAKYVYTNYRDVKVRNNKLFERDFDVLHTSMVGDANVNTLLVRK